MSEQMTRDTANVIVVVRMANDIHHLLGRVAAACWWVAAFFGLALVMDTLKGDWLSVAFMATGVIGFGLTGRDSWTRRRKYARFANLPTPPATDRAADGRDGGGR